MADEKRNKESMIIGSGELYCKEYTDGMTINTNDICQAANLVVGVQGGATLEYKPTYYEAKDDAGKHIETIITDEEATLKSGFVCKIGAMLHKLSPTARETTANGKREVKIGGLANNNRKSYVWCFWHKDTIKGDIWIIMRGQNQSGFSLAFVKDKESLVEIEVKGMPLDNDGTLIDYIEEIATVKTNSIDGETIPVDETNPEDE